MLEGLTIVAAKHPTKMSAAVHRLYRINHRLTIRVNYRALFGSVAFMTELILYSLSGSRMLMFQPAKRIDGWNAVYSVMG